jgi:receptor-type tyrosine-protein phosphatase F
MTQGYKVYYTTNPSQPMSSWQFQTVDNNQLTTISDLTSHAIYTIHVQALTSVGPGPLSAPVQIKTQQGVPSHPQMLTAVDIGETKVTLKWNKPDHSAENILSYELYWNDTYAKVSQPPATVCSHNRRLPGFRRRCRILCNDRRSFQ